MTATALILASLLAVGAPSAEVLSYKNLVRVDNEKTATCTVDISVRVNDKNGEEAGMFKLYLDSFCSLSSFSGTVTPQKGKPIKLKKGDLVNVSLSEGMANNAGVAAYVPDCQYPYTVNYSYKVAMKGGIIALPGFAPAVNIGTSVQKAEYVLQVPAGFPIQYSGNVEPEVTKDGKTDTYTWTAGDIAPLSSESFMPPATELLPFCRIAPVKFSFAGYPGSQQSWNDVGRWVSGLNDEVSDIPEKLAKTVADLVEGKESDMEKIAALYGYLGGTTRYVSIQLGIGGYQPSKASEVLRTGFGDCKALSNYMKLMLKAAGIESYYIILSTEDKTMDPRYPMAGFCDHAMLCVPVKELKDTLWLECTNAGFPLGFKHSGIAGHEVLLVDGDSSRVVRVPKYGTDCRTDSFVVSLDADGNAAVKAGRELKAGIVESYLGLYSATESEKKEMLNSSISARTDNFEVQSIRDNTGEYDGAGFEPEMEIGYRFDSPGYARTSKDRMFVPLAPAKFGLSAQKSERKYDIVIEDDALNVISTVVEIPEGYHIESLPQSTEVNCPWAAYTLECSLSEEGRLVVLKQSVSLKAGRFPASDYEQYREFTKAVKKVNSSNIVLVGD